jgi:hypothetical protein
MRVLFQAEGTVLHPPRDGTKCLSLIDEMRLGRPMRKLSQSLEGLYACSQTYQAEVSAIACPMADC